MRRRPAHAAAGVEAGQAYCLAWGPAAGGLQVYGPQAGLAPRGRGWAARQLVLPRPATGQWLTDLGLGWAGSIQESVRRPRAAVQPAWLDRSARGRSAWAGRAGSSGQIEQLGLRGVASFVGQRVGPSARGASRPRRPLRQL